MAMRNDRGDKVLIYDREEAQPFIDDIREMMTRAGQEKAATASVTPPNVYRGWTITRGRWPEPEWSATGPDYEAWTEGEGEWADNGRKADAATREALIAEINAWFEENAP
jgi:hypothetical protein